VLFLSDLFGLVPLLFGDFTVPAIESSDRFKIFYSKNLWGFFCRKQLHLYLHWLLWISFITFKKTATCMPSHLTAFALWCYAAVIGDKLLNEKKIFLLVLTS